jgi:hypothetical protein
VNKKFLILSNVIKIFLNGSISYFVKECGGRGFIRKGSKIRGKNQEIRNFKNPLNLFRLNYFRTFETFLNSCLVFNFKKFV